MKIITDYGIYPFVEDNVILGLDFNKERDYKATDIYLKSPINKEKIIIGTYSNKDAQNVYYDLCLRLLDGDETYIMPNYNVESHKLEKRLFYYNEEGVLRTVTMSVIPTPKKEDDIL